VNEKAEDQQNRHGAKDAEFEGTFATVLHRLTVTLSSCRGTVLRVILGHKWHRMASHSYVQTTETNKAARMNGSLLQETS